MTRLRTTFEHREAKPFPPFDRYAIFEASKGKSLPELLDTFAALRKQNLDDLRARELDLDRTGRHPDLGTVTLRQLLAAWVVYDLGPLRQIAKAMAYQNREEVGAWRKFLTILPLP